MRELESKPDYVELLDSDGEGSLVIPLEFIKQFFSVVH